MNLTELQEVVNNAISNAIDCHENPDDKMSIVKSMEEFKKKEEEFQKKEDDFRERQMVKMGDYSGDDCPNCGRHRVMVGDDGKRRCEKCCWCIEDDEYDTDFVRFMR